MNHIHLQNAFDSGELIVCLDIEATCCNDNSFPRSEMEIIEIGMAVFNPKDLSAPPSVWYSFVRPTIHTTLTDFCKGLTGITQDQVDEADTWDVVAPKIAHFLSSLNTAPNLWASWGDFDRNKIVNECSNRYVEYPLPGLHCNLKDAEATLCNRSKPLGLGGALRARKMPFPGQAHRAVNDAIAVQMVLKDLYRGHAV